MSYILLSNDDGVYAPGLSALVDVLSPHVRVQVIAPDRDRSGASNSLTLTTPLRTTELNASTISVQGTPTDCVHLALTGLLPEQPDMVISGINAGANLGDDVWYSGTVAAAMEGRFLGLPAIAVSLVVPHGEEVCHYKSAATVVETIYSMILSDPLPAGTILNVNVPNLPYAEINGYEVTRLGTRHPSGPMIERLDPRGNAVYWIGHVGAEQDSGLGTDFSAVSKGMVSITPLRVDLTHYEAFDQVSHWVGQLAVPKETML